MIEFLERCSALSNAINPDFVIVDRIVSHTLRFSL